MLSFARRGLFQQSSGLPEIHVSAPHALGRFPYGAGRSRFRKIHETVRSRNTSWCPFPEFAHPVELATLLLAARLGQPNF